MSDARELTCINGHDRCYLGPDPNCPYCELRMPRHRTNSRIGSQKRSDQQTPSESSRAAHKPPATDIDKLIAELLAASSGRFGTSVNGRRIRQAAQALTTLKAENERLRVSREYQKERAVIAKASRARASDGVEHWKAEAATLSSRIHELEEGLSKGREFAVMCLAFIGRDQGTHRIDKTLDGLCTLARETEEIAARLLNPTPRAEFAPACQVIEPRPVFPEGNYIFDPLTD